MAVETVLQATASQQITVRSRPTAGAIGLKTLGAAALSQLTPQELLDYLGTLGIEADTVEHEPVFTVAESRPIKARIPGAHSKNLFVKDKKGRLFLITAKDETAIDLKRVHEAIGASGRVSFGSAEQLREALGVEPGSVTPFAVVNDKAQRVTMILDANLMEHERVNFHPLVNSMTTGVSRDDLLRFLRATGHEPAILRLPEPASDNCQTQAAIPSEA